MRKPCNKCPFRRASLPGYLGSSSPERFMLATMRDDRMPCHKSVDYSNPAWEKAVQEARIGKECAGAAVFFANILKRSRDPRRLQMKPDRENVFAQPTEFIEHHRSGAKSWDEQEEQFAIDNFGVKT